MTTRDLWMIAVGVVVGFVSSWAFNRQMIKAMYAVERARHHYAAMTSWVSTLMSNLRTLGLLALLMAVLIAGGGWLLYYATVHGGI